ncbi:MAG: Rieske 2Fe-2S domain-containing protein [Pseudomonadota bacterium]|nr:Rieske 2Fe-2S domain-containing protein [Pseudomonadota bacterium]
MGKPFVRNAWYAACWAEDLNVGVPLAKTILSEPIALWRRENGNPVAFEDRCCHRHLPLSLGKITGETLRCGYHGLEFDAEGRCVRIPGQSRVPPSASVRSFPVCERHGMVWIWCGNPLHADEADIPALPWLDDPDWTRTGGHLHLKADYRLLIDNLLDLTHVTYIHADTIAGDPKEALVPVKTTREGEAIRVERWMLGFTAPPMYNDARKFAGAVDRWQLIKWQAPSIVTLDIGCADADTGAPEGDRSHGISMWSNHIITPETEKTTHYHWAFARNYSLYDDKVSEVLGNGGLQTFMEDVVVLECQQRSLEVIGDRPTVDIGIDSAPLQFRKILSARIAAERRDVSASTVCGR